jgi:hypothetical protein
MICGVLLLCRRKVRWQQKLLPLELGRDAAEYCNLYEGNYRTVRSVTGSFLRLDSSPLYRIG